VADPSTGPILRRMPPEPGTSAEVELTVEEADTAQAMGSGDVPVLATPRVVALCEAASMAAVRHSLGPGETTVGHSVQLDHVAPTRVGRRVRAEATLMKVEGRRLTFNVSVNDARGLVAAGKITRVLVNTDRFLEKAD
jgi:fluoroacetyl-CoA thioesterase